MGSINRNAKKLVTCQSWQPPSAEVHVIREGSTEGSTEVQERSSSPCAILSWYGRGAHIYTVYVQCNYPFQLWTTPLKNIFYKYSPESTSMLFFFLNAHSKKNAHLSSGVFLINDFFIMHRTSLYSTIHILISKQQWMSDLPLGVGKATPSWCLWPLWERYLAFYDVFCLCLGHHHPPYSVRLHYCPTHHL